MSPHSFEQSSDPELLRHHAHLRSKLELGKREQRRLSSTTTSSSSSSSSSSWDKHAVHHAASSPPTRSTVLIVRRTSSARALVNYGGVVTHSLLAARSKFESLLVHIARSQCAVAAFSYTCRMRGRCVCGLRVCAGHAGKLCKNG